MLFICWIIILLVFVGLLNWGLAVIFTNVWEWWQTQNSKKFGDITELKEEQHENDLRRIKSFDCESGIPQKTKIINEELYCGSISPDGRD